MSGPAARRPGPARGRATGVGPGLLLAACGVLVPFASDAAAESAPLSPIPWLSESIRESAGPPPPRPPAPPPAPGTEEIVVTPLDALRRDAVGLLEPAETGLPRGLWGPTTAPEAAARVVAAPGRGVPAAGDLLRSLLLADADPPAGPDAGDVLLVARIDRLLQDGALRDAQALISRAGPDTPELFRRWFDTGLLLDQVSEPCAALRQNPALSPTLPARVFCLARGGDWNAAEITLTLGENVGSISSGQQALLARFLDPQIFEGEPDPPIPDPLTPLEFLMREAVGLPRPSGPLPLAFLNLDLGANAPLRMRMEAAERLMASNGIPPQVLFDIYRAGKPAASGGAWDRAAAIQALDAALAAPDPRPEAIGTALVAADRAMAERGLRVAFASSYAAALAALDPAPLGAEARARLVRLLLLGDRPEAAAAAAGPAPDAGTATRLALAGAGRQAAPATDLERAAVAGIVARPPAEPREDRLAATIAEGRIGEGVLDAVALVEPGPTVDPTALEAALFALVRAGQEKAARRIAVQTLILAEGG